MLDCRMQVYFHRGGINSAHHTKPRRNLYAMKIDRNQYYRHIFKNIASYTLTPKSYGLHRIPTCFILTHFIMDNLKYLAVVGILD